MNTWIEDLKTACSALPRTGLERMDSVQLMRRFDSKYVVPESWLPEMIEAMQGHAHLLEVEGQWDSAYSNVYFEPPGDDFLMDHLRGKARRMKVRTRTYGSNGLSFLEVKRRLPGGGPSRIACCGTTRTPRNSMWQSGISCESMPRL